MGKSSGESGAESETIGKNKKTKKNIGKEMFRFFECLLTDFHKETLEKNLEIGVSTKLIVTARIRGNVLLKMSFVHI